jgi:uridine phosphorylase
MSVKKRIQPHIMCGIGDVADYVLLPGDPKRVERIASFFDEARKVADYRGFITYTGKVDGIGITACSTGIGCPSTAIVVEELSKLGAKTLIRVGTTGALQPNIDVGDIIVATGAVRSDGTSREYMPIEYPAVADFDIVSALLIASKDSPIKVHRGIIQSSDAFYAGSTDTLSKLAEGNVLSIEMESSTLFTLAGIKRIKAGTILAVDGNLVKNIKKGEFDENEKTGELDERVQRAIDEEIKIAIKAVKLLASNQSFS